MNNQIITPIGSTISYFLSTAVKVYPCAFRGNDDNNNPFDTEARSRTEKNVVNKYSKFTAKVASYVVDWKSETAGYSVTFVIDGYYCVISGLSTTDIATLAANKLIINTVSTNDAYSTLVLSNLYNSTAPLSTLDVKIGGQYLFCGIGIVASTVTSGYTASIKLFDKDTVDKYTTVSVIAWETGVEYYTLNSAGDYVLVNKTTTPTPVSGVTYYTKRTETKYYMSTSAATIFNVIEHGTGVHSLEMLVDDEDVSGNTATVAHSCKATAKNAVALGYGTVANNANEVAIGKYNDSTVDAAFVIGNGTGMGDTFRTNQLEVLKNGTVNVFNNTNNILNLGGNTAELGAGAINVFGSSTDKVFDVSNEGKVNIANDTTIGGKLNLAENLSINTDKFVVDSTTGNITSEGTITAAGKLTVKNTLEATGATTVGGTLDVTGATTLSSTASVGGKLTVSTGGADITGDTEIKNGTLKSAKKLTVSSEGADITGNTEIKNGTLKSAKKLTVSSEGADITGNTNIINGTLTSAKALTVSSGGATITGNSKVTGTMDVTDKLTVEANGAAITGAITGTESLTLSKITKDTADKETTVYGTITAGTITANGALTSTDKLTVKANGFDVTGASKVTGTFEATGAATLGSSLTVAGKATINGDIDSTGNLVLSQTDAKGVATYGSITCGAITSNANVSTAGTLTASGATTLRNTLGVAGNTTIGGTLSVTGAATFSSDITAGNFKVKSGNVVATSYDTTSDVRLKTNIKPFSCDKSILDLDVKTFEYISDENHITHVGCIAQELQEICPEIVHTTDDGYLAIQETKLVYLLLNEVKKLRADIELLKKEN